jgi:hypothetical protein
MNSFALYYSVIVKNHGRREKRLVQPLEKTRAAGAAQRDEQARRARNECPKGRAAPLDQNGEDVTHPRTGRAARVVALVRFGGVRSRFFHDSFILHLVSALKARCSSGHSVFDKLFATSLLSLVGARSFRAAAFRVAAVFPIHQKADSVAESGFDLVQVISNSVNILLKNSGRLFGGQAINFPQTK